MVGSVCGVILVSCLVVLGWVRRLFRPQPFHLVLPYNRIGETMLYTLCVFRVDRPFHVSVRRFMGLSYDDLVNLMMFYIDFDFAVGFGESVFDPSELYPGFKIEVIE